MEIKLTKKEPRHTSNIYEVYHLTIFGQHFLYRAIHCDIKSKENNDLIAELHILAEEINNKDLESLAEKVKIKHPIENGDLLRTKEPYGGLECIESLNEVQLEAFRKYLVR